jgi:hypothetical protein
MSRRRPTITTDDEPATVPAVVTPVRSDWSDWSQEHERKRLAENVRITQEAAERPIYPRELAERIAADYTRVSFPDWRLLRLESRGLLKQLTYQQPEMRQPEVQRRGELVNLLRSALPTALRPLLQDVELIADLTSAAREASAFMVGFSMGKKAGQTYVDSRGRLRGTRAARPRSGLRLALDE